MGRLGLDPNCLRTRKKTIMLSRIDRSGKKIKPFASPPRVWALIIMVILIASCERVPSKSDYVSAQVTKLCAEKSSDALRACRIAVITQFKDTPLEELQRRFPKPEPRGRPSSCSG